MNNDIKICAVIPVYNHGTTVGAVVGSLRAHGLLCVLVDDGSAAACATALDDLALADPDGVCLVRLAQNQGKGGAMMAGFDEAQRLGYTHALQIDSDGQHDAGSIGEFLQLTAAHPGTIICGCPIYDDSVPKSRLYGRYATHIWVWINTLSFAVRDSMCGFRVYPLQSTIKLIHEVRIGRRMDFDTEILVRLVWRGVPVINVPTRVRYPLDGISHFKLWEDNLRISWMHTKLFFGMLLRLPMLLWRKLGARSGI
ncbi:MAG: glycosyltransferase family 2 protein [Pseudomonadota bacterium]